jgi:hypothetical protein
MLNFQLPPSRLAPAGTRLFVSGNSGLERVVIQTGKQVTLELAGLPGSSSKPTIRQVPLNSTTDLIGVLLPALSTGPDVVSISAPVGSGTKRTFTMKGDRPGMAAVIAEDSNPLLVVVGSFLNDPDFDIDLIADVFRASDAAKTHVLTRLLFSNRDNLFNEDSAANQQQWCPPGGCLPCGTVSKVGASAVFHPVDYDYQPYNKPVPGMQTAAARTALKREDVKYDEARLKRGCAAIKSRLAKGIPSLVGLTYIPSSAVQANGTFNETGDGGHTVPIVGCDANATKFLYIDVYEEGSKLKYKGGHAGRDLFPDECHHLGVFELVNDPARGSFVLRARVGTAASAVFDGNQFLEVISGPLTA